MVQTAEHRRLIRLAAAYNKKARRIGSRGVITALDLGRIEVEMPTCYYCGISLEVGQGTFDHLQPFNRGGQNRYSNIVRCCITCNRVKFTKSPEQLAEHQIRYVLCAVCGKEFRPRWAEYENGRARLCSRRCAALKRWQMA